MRPSIFGALLIVSTILLVEARGNGGKIEQCECDSLMECRKEAREQETPCIEKCRKKLNHQEWNKEEGLKCFDQPENTEHHQCMHAIALQTCSNVSGVMINKNETFHSRGHMRHNHRKPRAIDATDRDLNEEKYDNEENEISHPNHEQHRPREHNKRAFYAFMRRHFGQSGKAFVTCMQKCGKHRHHDDCPRTLKCGVKKLPPKEFHQKSAECHKKQTPRRYEVCGCLKNAGLSQLDCTFGGRNSPSDQDSSTKKP